jgi:acetyl-CoA acetyltransferase/uncharacterized OB-fold protein
MDDVTDLGGLPGPWLMPWDRPFWEGGADGQLRVQKCSECDQLRHPPGPCCSYCGSHDLAWTVVSGTATVVAFTTNHRQWEPQHPSDPFVIAVVALDEDQRVRLTTNIVGCPPEAVVIGMRVRVHFEHRRDAWVPLFTPEPDAAPLTAATGAPGLGVSFPRRSSNKFEDKCLISGVGSSRIGRRLLVDPIELTVEACKAAVGDAGLRLSDIDGLSTYPGPQDTGMTEGGITPLEDVLQIRPTWFSSGFELPGQLGSVVAAMMAVATGLCRHVLCYRTVWQSTESDLQRRGDIPYGSAPRIWGSNWRAPFGATKAISTLAAAANRYLHEYGATRETLGWIAINARANAGRNPEAIYRDPLSMDEYLTAPVLSSPFGLYDCDVLCDGAIAVVISTRDAHSDLRHPPVLVDAVGTRIAERVAWDQGVLTHEPQVFGPAAHLWSRTSLKPADVDVAELYDGFTFNALSWLEALGFCAIGEGKYFVDGGREIGLEGSLPLNTHGGQLSAGRLHGYGYLHEAVLQLRGQAGARQVPHARTAAVSSGGLTPGGAMLLTQAP